MYPNEVTKKYFSFGPGNDYLRPIQLGPNFRLQFQYNIYIVS